MIESAKRIFERSEDLLLSASHNTKNAKDIDTDSLVATKTQGKPPIYLLFLLVSKWFLGLPKKFIRLFVYPYSMLRVGSAAFFRPLNVFMASLTILTTIYLAFPEEFSLQPDLDINFQLLLLFFPVLITLFPSPSNYIFNHLKNSNIERVQHFIKQEKIKTEKEIELLEECIKILYLRSESRFNLYKKVILTCSSIFVFIQSLGLKVILIEGKLKGKVDTQIIFDNFITPLAVAFFLTLIAFILLSVYKRATTIIFNTIEFSCISQKKKLLKNASHSLSIPRRARN